MIDESSHRMPISSVGVLREQHLQQNTQVTGSLQTAGVGRRDFREPPTRGAPLTCIIHPGGMLGWRTEVLCGSRRSADIRSFDGAADCHGNTAGCRLA
jgi:hypothetical protein